MIYVFQAILLVFLLACITLSGVLWSISHGDEGLRNEINLSHLLYKSAAIGGGFAIYAVLDYAMLNYLMLLPGANYVMA